MQSPPRGERKARPEQALHQTRRTSKVLNIQILQSYNFITIKHTTKAKGEAKGGISTKQGELHG